MLPRVIDAPVPPVAPASNLTSSAPVPTILPSMVILPLLDWTSNSPADNLIFPVSKVIVSS